MHRSDRFLSNSVFRLQFIKQDHLESEDQFPALYNLSKTRQLI